MKKHKCSGCQDTGHCLGIRERKAGRKGCKCKSFDDCPTLGECPLECEDYESLFEEREQIYERIADGTLDAADRETLATLERVAPESLHREPA